MADKLLDAFGVHQDYVMCPNVTEYTILNKVEGFAALVLLNQTTNLTDDDKLRIRTSDAYISFVA